MVTLTSSSDHVQAPNPGLEWATLSLGASCKLLGRLTAELSHDARALVRLRVFEAAVEDGLSFLASGTINALHIVDLTLMGDHLKSYAADGNPAHLARVDAIVTTPV